MLANDYLFIFENYGWPIHSSSDVLDSRREWFDVFVSGLQCRYPLLDNGSECCLFVRDVSSTNGKLSLSYFIFLGSMPELLIIPNIPKPVTRPPIRYLATDSKLILVGV